jgi:GNAT superfamily N-acetyltransferase
MTDIRIESVEGEAVRGLGGELLALCEVIFPGFAADYLTGRLVHIDAPAAVVARDGGGRLVGFKLGYRRGAGLFYSWLGGIHPDVRRQGLARRLMTAQHLWARDRGYRSVETRTRASNNPMIILNLQSGFHVAGFEVDRNGQPTVTQRLILE